MTAKLEMSDEAYAVLKEDIDGVKTVAVQVRGLVPNHIWSRIDYLATDLASILRDGVDIVKDEEDEFRRHHVNLDADPSGDKPAFDSHLEQEYEDRQTGGYDGDEE